CVNVALQVAFTSCSVNDAGCPRHAAEPPQLANDQPPAGVAEIDTTTPGSTMQVLFEHPVPVALTVPMPEPTFAAIVNCCVYCAVQVMLPVGDTCVVCIVPQVAELQPVKV